MRNFPPFTSLRGLLFVSLLAAIVAGPVASAGATEPEGQPNEAAVEQAPAAKPETNSAEAGAKTSEAAADETPAAAPESNTAEKNVAKPDEAKPGKPKAKADEAKKADAAKKTETPTEPKSNIVVDIDKSTQRMTVFVDGIEEYSWPVSTGGAGYDTPSGSFTAQSMNKVWYSKEWDNAPMPHSIFFTKKGHAIHGSYETKKLGRAVSHGCVRLAPENAKKLFALVATNGLENTEVVIKGSTGLQMAKPQKRRGQQYEYGEAWPNEGYYPYRAYRPYPYRGRKRVPAWRADGPPPWFRAPPRRRLFGGPYYR